jgi:hypothetical protein
MYYVLDEQGNPKKIDDVLKWAHVFQSTDRQIALDRFDDVTVSTIFIGIDYLNNVVPLLFETMIFGGEYDGYQIRSPTKKDALIGHKKALDKIRTLYEATQKPQI